MPAALRATSSRPGSSLENPSQFRLSGRDKVTSSIAGIDFYFFDTQFYFNNDQNR